MGLVVLIIVGGSGKAFVLNFIVVILSDIIVIALVFMRTWTWCIVSWTLLAMPFHGAISSSFERSVPIVVSVSISCCQLGASSRPRDCCSPSSCG
jgi:hypothetical protein